MRKSKTETEKICKKRKTKIVKKNLLITIRTESEKQKTVVRSRSHLEPPLLGWSLAGADFLVSEPFFLLAGAESRAAQKSGGVAKLKKNTKIPCTTFVWSRDGNEHKLIRDLDR